jgi:hypothetical protein
MNRIVLKSKVGADGVLRLTLPIGAEEANQEVQVTVEPAAARRPMTREEWENFILSTAGSITDPTFTRHEQGEYERREDLP